MPTEIYCDGSSSGKSGQPTGWAWVAVDVETQQVLFQGSKASAAGTNNTAELFAVIDGLMECIKREVPKPITLVSDSMYALGISCGRYTPTKNPEEARLARALYVISGAGYRWVRGHSGDTWNEMVDDLAGKARASMLPEKKKTQRKNGKAKQKKKELKKKYLEEVGNEKKVK